MRRILRTFDFFTRSVVLVFLLGGGLVGFSCVRHGDIGPYPEVDYMWAVPPLAMFLAFIWMDGGDE